MSRREPFLRHGALWCRDLGDGKEGLAILTIEDEYFSALGWLYQSTYETFPGLKIDQ
ncbi:hypothetical protein GCM10011488_68460 [Steroidobacter agaridevorans]|nr:hypothetical protein GCM10011488_68460 [Steroidobacter agaridevorans]